MPAKRRRGRPPGRERAADPAITLIKKYGNRRLYDTRRSRTVTLDDVCELIAAGEDVKVVDAKSGEDLTKRVVCKLIFLEEQRRNLDLLPLDLLRRVLVHRDDARRALERPELEELKARLAALEARFAEAK
jgi:polyhydroxyalkanoate synthesis repressor PhaR